jgi:beta-N-acetylhexosaminidase
MLAVRNSRGVKFFIAILCFLLLPACERRVADNAEHEDIIDPLRIQAAEIVSLMDERLLTAQILITGIDGRGTLPPHMSTILQGAPAGGVMLFRYNLNTANDGIRYLINQVTSLILEESGIPPFIAVDHEGGTVNRFMRGIAALPSASSYREIFVKEGKDTALEKIEKDSFRAGLEISNLGLNMNFAPVAEYLNDDNRDFLRHRSYGEDPVFTALASAAFIRGMEQAGVLCVIKHFPGSAGPDPHYSPSVLNTDRAGLDKLAYPFARLIKNETRAIMVAHSLAPAMDDKITSLSSVVMQNWLREDLGFNGLIICDDFTMAAAGNLSSEEAAVLSVAAGADMILVWQRDLRRTHNALLAALADGRLSLERLTDAAERVVYEKLRFGLMKQAVSHEQTLPTDYPFAAVLPLR